MRYVIICNGICNGIYNGMYVGMKSSLKLGSTMSFIICDG